MSITSVFHTHKTRSNSVVLLSVAGGVLSMTSIKRISTAKNSPEDRNFTSASKEKKSPYCLFGEKSLCFAINGVSAGSAPRIQFQLLFWSRVVGPVAFPTPNVHSVAATSEGVEKTRSPETRRSSSPDEGITTEHRMGSIRAKTGASPNLFLKVLLFSYF